MSDPAKTKLQRATDRWAAYNEMVAEICEIQMPVTAELQSVSTDVEPEKVISPERTVPGTESGGTNQAQHQLLELPPPFPIPNGFNNSGSPANPVVADAAQMVERHIPDVMGTDVDDVDLDGKTFRQLEELHSALEVVVPSNTTTPYERQVEHLVASGVEQTTAQHLSYVAVHMSQGRLHPSAAPGPEPPGAASAAPATPHGTLPPCMPDMVLAQG